MCGRCVWRRHGYEPPPITTVTMMQVTVAAKSVRRKGTRAPAVPHTQALTPESGVSLFVFLKAEGDVGLWSSSSSSASFLLSSSR